MSYNWQHKDWPEFSFDENIVLDKILAYTEHVGRVSGMVKALSDEVETEVVIAALVAEAVKTSEIEGEFISREDVMSSIRNNLGLNATPEKIKDRRAGGIVKMMLSVRESYAASLSRSEIFAWHKLLMEGNHYVRAGAWRSSAEPMQVVSGPAGREHVHYEAPPAAQVPDEMKKFIAWFNDTAPGGKKPILYAPVRSALAHLYFETIHPFEDGNGRMGRAISEKVLSQHAGRPVILSLSQVIEADKKTYYNALKKGQRSNEVTEWLKYFIGAILKAQKLAEEQIEFVIKKTRFFDQYKDVLNARQLKAVKKMLDQGPSGFEGGMSARKYTSITKASKATATRDLQDFAAKGILVPDGEGRSRRYFLTI